MIEARDLSKRYEGGAWVLDGVSFTVAAGEMYVLLGGPASGKTTLLGLFLGVDAPTRGRALVEGVDARANPIVTRSLLTFVSARTPVHLRRTVRENVALFAGLAGVRFGPNAIATALRRAGIAEREFERKPTGLSRSLAVRLWVAVAFLRDTHAVLLDEPTRDLTPQEATEVEDGLSELKSRGKAVLVTTADILFATEAPGRVGILNSGRIASERTGAELVSQRLTDVSLDYRGLAATDAESRRRG